MSEERHIHTNRSGGSHSAAPRKINRSTASHSGAGRSTASRSTASRSTASHSAAGHSGGSGRAPAPQNGRKKRKRMPVWLPLVVVLCIVGIAAGVVLGYVNSVMTAIAPESGTAQIAEEVKTIEEYKGDVVGVLLCGIDYEEGRTYGGDSESNDGMTDMIMYIQFDVKNSKVNMLQIPRNTLVGASVTCATTGKTYRASNYQINSIALSNEDGIAALADVIYNNYKLPVDYYATINMQALKELVDRFGGLEVYIPQDLSYNGSTLYQGYRNLNGDAVEFLVRNRHSYSDGDISRLNTQRYVYAAFFKYFRTMTPAEILHLMPVFTYYVKTDMDVGTIASLGAAFITVDSADIMVAQTPMYTAASLYHENSVLVPARAEIADLLNLYYRSYTGEVAASELNLADDLVAVVGSPTNANIQYMGQLDAQADAAAASTTE